MEESGQSLNEIINSPDFEPEQLGVRFWFEQYSKRTTVVDNLRELGNAYGSDGNEQELDDVCAPIDQCRINFKGQEQGNKNLQSHRLSGRETEPDKSPRASLNATREPAST